MCLVNNTFSFLYISRQFEVCMLIIITGYFEFSFLLYAYHKYIELYGFAIYILGALVAL